MSAGLRLDNDGLRIDERHIRPPRGVSGILIKNVHVEVLPPLTIRCRARFWPAIRWLAKRMVVE